MLFVRMGYTMSNAIFACSNCGYRQELDPVHTGKEFSCPTCGEVVIAEAAIQSSSPVQAVPDPHINYLSSKSAVSRTSERPDSLNEQNHGSVSTEESSDDGFRLPDKEFFASRWIMLQKKWDALQVGSRLRNLTASLESPLFFLAAYLLLMILTYIFPSPGDTANGSGGAFLSASPGSILLSGLHFLCGLGLIGICFLRGVVLNRVWLALYPISIMRFALSVSVIRIPYSVRILHAVTIVLGMVAGDEARKPTPTANKSTNSTDPERGE